MNFPPEILEQIFYSSIETLIISQLLNRQIRKLTNNKFNKLDRNLLMTEFTRSGCKFHSNKDLLVIHVSDYIDDIKYEKHLTSNCYLITFNEYLRTIDKNYEQNRVSYVYGKKVTSRIYVHPCKMIVKKIGGIHEDFFLSKEESLKDVCDSKDYVEINFTLVFDIDGELY